MLLYLTLNAALPDSRLAFTDAYAETYPFMLYSGFSSPIYFRYVPFTAEQYVFNNSDIVHRTLYYDNYAQKYFRDSEAGIMFNDARTADGLNYGLALINDIYSNNIYSSINLKQNETELNGYSYFNIPSVGGYTHYNTLNAVWKFISADVFLSNSESGMRAGYHSEMLDVRAGITTEGKFPAVIRLNAVPVNVFGYGSYDPGSGRLDKNINVMLPLRFGRWNIMPLVNYSDTLKFYTGALYRLTQYISVYANAGYDFTRIPIKAGLRFMNEKQYIDIQAGVNAENRGVLASASVRTILGPAAFMINASYEDSLEYEAGLLLSGTMFNGHLSPGIILSYREDIVYTGIKADLLDASLFFGSYWNIADTTYALTGGFEWYFFEKSQLLQH